MKVSNCCFVKGEAWVSGFIRLDYEKAELCPKCGEHCEYIEETTFETINTENETNRSKEGTPVQVEGSINK